MYGWQDLGKEAGWSLDEARRNGANDPFVLADTIHDDRDPHIAALKDGTLLCNWFVAPNPKKPLSGNRPIAIYGIYADQQNNAYILEFRFGGIGNALDRKRIRANGEPAENSGCSSI